MSSDLMAIAGEAEHGAERAARSPSLTISNAVVRLLRSRTGRGPSKAKTVITADMVVVTLRDCLTTMERTFADAGDARHVIRGRQTVHNLLRPEATVLVEEATGKRVTAYLGDQHHDPDIAVLVFILGPAGT